MGEICRCVIPELCPNCCFLPETQVYRIRKVLKENPTIKIKFNAFNSLEVNKIKKLLSIEELKRVFFTWYNFRGV